ncbi:MarR family winged helix-turn-helix transcriptional regulator [Hoyosella altamirensis]|uniref:DNA-binding MarR family transcriptional regulator n=1 Tax=Hoyosella altamirensis TaxID=616997 RepID=A0A839RHZ4_9ACTN|nr:MarR family transcriptional regulator [Hoyosella altamirensis]MBB3035743.1 DNA-binding MarR family transcriptional regulator [Hoyosella altamirensis]
MSDTDATDATDAIDELVGQWRARLDRDGREQTHFGDLSVVGTGARLTRAAQHFGKHVRALHAKYDLEWWEFDVLATLYRAADPGGLSGKALIRAMLLTSGAITNRVDRLVTRGFVERRTDPADRRSMLVGLTDTGRRKVEAVMPAHVANEEALFSALTAVERVQLDAILRKFLIARDDTTLSP